MVDYPLQRFADLAPLAPREVARLRSLGDAPAYHRRGDVIRAEGVRANALYLLLEGWAAASMLMPSGERQMLKVHVPGDMLGSPSMVLETACETLTALTDCAVARVPFTRLRDLFADEPRLGAMFLMACQLERVALMDAVTSMGRASAREGLLGFLLDIHRRVSRLGLAQGDSFDLPLSQVQLGELVGITNVHMNRLLRDLREQGLVRFVGRTVTLLDLPALVAESPLPNRVVRYDPDWFPNGAANEGLADRG